MRSTGLRDLMLDLLTAQDFHQHVLFHRISTWKCSSHRCGRGSKLSLVTLPGLLNLFQIFLLYTALNQGGTELTGPDGHRGLGFIDSRQDTLSIKFELAAPIRHESSTGTSENKRSFQPRKARQQKKEINLTKVIEIGIFQDKTALRSRKGDTGSVVWRAR